METYLEIIHHPLADFTLKIIVTLLTLMMGFSFRRKRTKYKNSSLWYNLGPGSLGGGYYESTPQATWASVLFIWFIVAVLGFWVPASAFWAKTQLVLLSVAMNFSIITLLLDDNDSSNNLIREKSKLYVIVLSILFTISVFFHFNSTAVNLWYAGIIAYTAYIHFTRNYYFSENKLIGVAMLLLVIALVIKTFPSIIPNSIDKLHPSRLFSPEIQIVALLIIKRQAMKVEKVRGFC